MFKIKKVALRLLITDVLSVFFEISVEDHFFWVIIISLLVIFGLKNPPPGLCDLGQRQLPNIHVNLVTLALLSL